MNSYPAEPASRKRLLRVPSRKPLRRLLSVIQNRTVAPALAELAVMTGELKIHSLR